MNGKNLIIFVWFLLVSGCADLGPKLYPVSGKVQVSGQDIAVLEGSAIEIKSDADNSIRAAGTINADGSFVLETIQMGRMQKGAREGDFKARIVISDDDKAKLKLASKLVQAKYLEFEPSGWKIKVPVSSDVLLNLETK
jgi:hypothetical protein